MIDLVLLIYIWKYMIKLMLKCLNRYLFIFADILRSQLIDHLKYFPAILATVHHVGQRIVLAGLHQVVARSLANVEHEGLVNVLRQLATQKADLVVG